MATRCQTGAWSGSGEGQNVVAVNPFWDKKKGGGGAVNFKVIIGILAYNIIGTLAYKLCLYFLYFMKYMTFLI